MKRKALTLAVNLEANRVRLEDEGGRRWLVAPVVSARESVMNWYLVTRQALSNSAEHWEGIPVTLQHPPDQLEQPEERQNWINSNTLGTIRRAWMSNEKLVNEVWLEYPGRTREAQAITAHLLNGGSIDVSTGYWVFDPVEESGSFEGRNYSQVHTQIEPEHLAILPGGVGACSRTDGCGIGGEVKTNKKRKGAVVPLDPQDRELVANRYAQAANEGLSLDDRINAVRMAIVDMAYRPSDESTWPWVRAVFEDHAIFEQADQLFRVTYELAQNDEGLEVTLGEPERGTLEFKPAEQAANSADQPECGCKKGRVRAFLQKVLGTNAESPKEEPEEITMDRNEALKLLAAKVGNAEALTAGLDDAAVIKMAQNAQTTAEPAAPAAPAPTTPPAVPAPNALAGQPTLPAQNTAAPITREAIEAAFPELKGLVAAAQNKAVEVRNEVKALKVLDDAVVDATPVPALEALLANNRKSTDFSGAAGAPSIFDNGDQPELSPDEGIISPQYTQ